MKPDFQYRLQQATWMNASLKVIGYLSVFAIADMLVPGLYGSFGDAAATVLVLTLIGLFADVTIVPVLGSFLSLIPGYPAMVVITWWMASWDAFNHVTLLRAAIMAVFLGPIEYCLHRMVLNTLGKGRQG